MGGAVSKHATYEPLADTSSNNAPSSSRQLVRFINFEHFKTLGSLPYYREKHRLCTSIEKIDLKESLIVFISHCWQRSWPGSEGYTDHPHPDTPNHDIYKLCVEGIEKLKSWQAPGMKHCYVWLDYGCLDLEKLRQHLQHTSNSSSAATPTSPSMPHTWTSDIIACMDCVMRASDVLFTPVYDAEQRGLPSSSFQDIYSEYLAPGWKAEKVT